MFEKEIWELVKLTIGICIGSYLGTKLVQRTLKKQFIQIIAVVKEEYKDEITEIKTRATNILSDIETLIKHANKFFGVKQNGKKKNMSNQR